METNLGNTDVVANIAVKDLAVAQKFYQDTLGLKLQESHDKEVLTFKSGSNTLFVYRSEFAGTNKATAVTWPMKAIDEVVASLKAQGVSFEHYDMPGLERKGDIHIGGPMKVAWFKDPDGNILCLAAG